MASHTQRPFRHRCPPAHAGPPPQLHVPIVEQSGASVASHAVHAFPTRPQVSPATGSQVLPAQQPVVHVDAHPAHTPSLHGWPSGQEAQLRPAAPHAVLEDPDWQVPVPSQQPFGHEIGSHTHALSLQR